jgi:hypothetical protein
MCTIASLYLVAVGGVIEIVSVGSKIRDSLLNHAKLTKSGIKLVKWILSDDKAMQLLIHDFPFLII